MMRLTLALMFSIALGAATPAPHVAAAPGLPAAGATAQCRGTDRPINKQIRFARGRTTAVIKDTIRLCTSHEYTLRARAGQTMSVHLAAGDRTSFTVYAPTDRIADADGVKDWSGELPETGQYQISIGTDANAAYTLEVTIR
jgi:hypothetical protein